MVDKSKVDRLDEGGTSTDVSRFSGRYEIVYETTMQVSRFNHHNLISILSQLVVALVSRSETVCSFLGPKAQEQNLVLHATGEWRYLFLADSER